MPLPMLIANRLSNSSTLTRSRGVKARLGVAARTPARAPAAGTRPTSIPFS